MWKWKVETKIRTIRCRWWQDGWSNLLFIFQTGKMWNYLRSKSQGYFFHTMWNPYTQLFGWYQLCDPSMCNLPSHSWEIQVSKACLTQQYLEVSTVKPKQSSQSHIIRISNHLFSFSFFLFFMNKGRLTSWVWP